MADSENCATHDVSGPVSDDSASVESKEVELDPNSITSQQLDGLLQEILGTTPSVADSEGRRLDTPPGCADTRVDFVLRLLVEKGHWFSVVQVLERGVSNSQRRWAVLEACQRYTDVDALEFNDNVPIFKSSIYSGWPLCSIKTLCLCNEESKKPIEGLPETHSALEHILSHRADDQLDSIISILCKHRRISALHTLFQQKGVSDSQKRWVVQEICAEYERDSTKNKFLTVYCTDDQLDSVVTYLVELRDWKRAAKFAKRGASDSQKRWCILEACAHASEFCIVRNILPRYVYEDTLSVMKQLFSRKMTKAALVLLHQFVIDTLHTWAVVESDIDRKEDIFWKVLKNPCDEIRALSPTDWKSLSKEYLPYTLQDRLGWDTLLCEVLYESLWEFVKETWVTGREEKVCHPSRSDVEEAKSAFSDIHKALTPAVLQSSARVSKRSKSFPFMVTLRQRFATKHDDNVEGFALEFMKHLIHACYKDRARPAMTDAILKVLSTVPVAPAIQSAALRVMLRHERWDIIRHACLSHVLEHDRRQLLQEAVKQRKWSAVKRWADHALYDDQRWWALEAAYEAKQWKVYLLLADYGLTEVQLMRVHRRLFQHANWDVLWLMFERGGQVTEAKEVLLETMRSQNASRFLEKHETFDKVWKLENLEKKLTPEATSTYQTSRNKELKWRALLHRIVRCPGFEDFSQALTEAMEDNAWHVVIQLVRLGMDAARRDSLFPEMVRRQQWGVCRALLEQRVGVQLCLDALPELMARSQWTLVGRVMEYNVDDALRRQVMSRALNCREGSVVWKCISTSGYRLSVTEREGLFNQALLLDIWQVMKPLIEEKDETGIRHRDTALLEAIEQHQWDVVDHCQRHHADINMKDDEGHTPIQRAAWKRDWSFSEAEEVSESGLDKSQFYCLADWQGVRELVVRGGDPSQLDEEGYSVLHRSIRAKELDTVKLLIQFHGDIHLPAHCGDDCDDELQQQIHDGDRRTPLEMLIDERHGELIESTLMWCPDQWKARGYRGTALHAVCLSGWPDTLYYLIARKVDPLAVTVYGSTALCYAVLCEDCPQRMVAECIKLGFSTHQPHITDTAVVPRHHYRGSPSEETKCLLKSPLVLAVMQGLPVVIQMLYESGACSSKQLFELNSHIFALTDRTPREGKELRSSFKHLWRTAYDDQWALESPQAVLVQQSADYLHQVSSTPRSLVSTCRLVISRCLTLSKMRQGDIAQLPLSPMMRKYLLFSDLTDPAQGK